MLKKSVALAGIMLFGTGAFAQAACTPEEAQEKGAAFVQDMMALAEKDPKKYAEVAQAMQTQLPELQKLNDIEELCKFYDEWKEKMK